MLFVPPSMPLMIPEAFAAQDKGDFKLEYWPTTEYADYERWIQSEQYFEKNIKALNENLALPHDIVIVVAECDGTNAWYDPEAKEIVYCYQLMEDNFKNMDQ